jgi:hypothetical protein
MTRARFFLLRTALAAVRVRMIASQIGLALLVFALAIVWLHVPDSSALYLIATVVLGVGIVALASVGEVALMLRLCRRSMTRGRLLQGALLLIVGTALWVAWYVCIDHFRAKDILRAGYWNSRFPASLRNFFSFPRIYQWLEWMWSALDWFGAGILAVLVFAVTAGERTANAIKSALFSITYWAILIVGSLAAPILTDFLMGWTPGHGLAIETFSLFLRLSIAITADATIVVLVLTVVAACILQSDANHEAPAGAPEVSQPRTTGIP